jgi:hypothetical protein
VEVAAQYQGTWPVAIIMTTHAVKVLALQSNCVGSYTSFLNIAGTVAKGDGAFG